MCAAPSSKPRFADRDLACEAAIAAEFETFALSAQEAGWSKDEVANALLSLAQNHALALRDDAVVDAATSVKGPVAQ